MIIDVDITMTKSPRQNHHYHHMDKNVMITTATTSSSSELAGDRKYLSNHQIRMFGRIDPR
jgi:hypothetical protein